MTKWIELEDALEKYSCDEKILEKMIVQGEVKSRIEFIDDEAIYLIEDKILLLRAAKKGAKILGSSAARILEGVIIGAAGGVAATKLTVLQNPKKEPKVSEALQQMRQRIAQDFLNRNMAVPDEAAQHIRYLDFSWKKFTDLSLLSNFPILETLILRGDQVTNISSLPHLPNLKHLNVGIKVVDFSILINFPHLETLNLGHTKIESISFLESFTNLKKLDIRYTRVIDFDALKNLQYLQELELYGTNFFDGRILSNLTNLQILGLTNTKIDKIDGLENLLNLKKLYLGYTNVSDIELLRRLKKLDYVVLGNTKVTDFTPVAHVKEKIGIPDDYHPTE